MCVSCFYKEIVMITIYSETRFHNDMFVAYREQLLKLGMIIYHAIPVLLPLLNGVSVLRNVYFLYDNQCSRKGLEIVLLLFFYYSCYIDLHCSLRFIYNTFLIPALPNYSQNVPFPPTPPLIIVLLSSQNVPPPLTENHNPLT